MATSKCPTCGPAKDDINKLQAENVVVGPLPSMDEYNYDPSLSYGENYNQAMQTANSWLPYKKEDGTWDLEGLGFTSGWTQEQAEEIYQNAINRPYGSGTGTAGTCPSGVPCAGEAGVSGIGEVPAYEQSPELKAWQEKFGGNLTEWLENPQGIPAEAKAQMKQSLYDDLMANQEENIRVMTNKMERRGITNSGFAYSNEQKIRANTTKTLAESYRNIEIQDAMMKVASWETAMGQTAQYLSYLSNESYMAYQPKLMEWQAKFDVYKMQLNQAYQQSNITLQSQLTSQMNAQQHIWDVEMAEMEIEATQAAALAEAQGSISGTVVTGLFSLATKLL